MFRHRYKGDRNLFSDCWTLVRESDPGGDITNCVPEHYVERHGSIMEDNIIGRLRYDNSCVHLRRNVILQGVLPSAHTAGYSGMWHVHPPTIWHLPEGDPGGPFLDADYEKFILNASRHFKEQFNSEVSLANFLFELKDFRKIVQSLGQLVFPGRSKRITRARGLLKDRLDMGVGGNFLDYTFNWKSLVGDIPKLFSAYEIAMKRLEFLVGHSSWISHRRIKFTVEPGEKGFDQSLVLDASAVVFADATIRYKIWLVPDWCQVEMNASAHLSNKLEMATIEPWIAMADQLGLNNSVKIAWNATKLSWLVDFFLDSKQFLKAFEVETFKGHLGIESGTASVKVTKSYSIVCEINTATGVIESIPVGSVLFRNYRRDVLSVRQATMFSVADPLNTDQQLILAALAESQFKIGGRVAGFWKKLWTVNSRTWGRGYWKRPKG